MKARGLSIENKLRDPGTIIYHQGTCNSDNSKNRHSIEIMLGLDFGAAFL